MNLYPNGAMSTTAADMARFGIAHLVSPHPSILMAASWDAMHTRQFANIPQGAGLTFGFEESLWNGHRAIGHGGDIAGYKAHLVMFPEQRISIFVVFNSDSTGGAGDQVISAFADRYLPGESNYLFSQAPLVHATDDIEGDFVSSRRNWSTLEKLYWPISTGLSIRRLSRTDISVHFFGHDRLYRRQGPGVYAPLTQAGAPPGEFGALLARKAPNSGATQIFFTQIAAFMFERPRPSEDLALQGKLLVLGLSLACIGALTSIVSAFTCASRRSLRGVLACGFGAAGALLMLAFIPLLAGHFTGELVYGVSAAMRALFVLPLAALACAGTALMLTILAWRIKRPHVAQILGVAICIGAVALLCWQLQTWNMLGFGGLPR
jgi:hypothetical protein